MTEKAYMTTTSVIQHLERILTGETDIAFWKVLPKGQHHIKMLSVGNNTTHKPLYLNVSNDILSSIDSRLPSVIKNIVTPLDGYVYMERLILTYTSHWKRRNHRLAEYNCVADDSEPSKADNNRWYIHEFTDAEFITDAKAAAFVKLYDISETEDGIEYVASSHLARLYKLENWLHECVPGGTKLLHVWETMDIPSSEWGACLQKEYTEHALREKTVTPSVSIPTDGL